MRLDWLSDKWYNRIANNLITVVNSLPYHTAGFSFHVATTLSLSSPSASVLLCTSKINLKHLNVPNKVEYTYLAPSCR